MTMHTRVGYGHQ